MSNDLKIIDPSITSRARIQWSRVIGAAILVLFAAQVALAFGRKLLLSHQTAVRLGRTQAELDRLQRENIELRKEKEALFHPEKIEQLAREKLGLTKPNEIAVKIIKRDSAQTSASQDKAIVPHKTKTLWEKLKEELSLSWLLKSGRS